MEPGFESPYRYQPSLALANVRASYGWQATRRLSTEAAKQRRWTAASELTRPTREGCPPKLAVIPGERRWTTCNRSLTTTPVDSFSGWIPRWLKSPSNPRGKRLAPSAVMLKRSVYVLRNAENPPRYYTGITSNVTVRHAEHNAGGCTHTAKYRPWAIDVVIEFADERRALAFERYLKSGSGVSFSQRHLR